ncbi:MAG: hypothetical protein V3T23_04570, partial [Nitrososphaerales archaeon]
MLFLFRRPESLELISTFRRNHADWILFLVDASESHVSRREASSHRLHKGYSNGSSGIELVRAYERIPSDI